MYLKDGTLLQGGEYRIVSFISSGGFGCTYEAEHVMLRKRVAIKEFFVSDFCERDVRTGVVSFVSKSKTELLAKLRRKFLEEAQAVSCMNHPCIVGVLDVFEENNTAYYAMDFIDGQSLSDMLKRRKLIPENEALGYIRQVADALSYVHSLNRLHLDIKPANVMVDKEGKAILIDFGTSKQYDEVNGENTSTLMGRTQGYAPPEQMDNSVAHFSPSTDIYALGATLYKLLTGITPPSSSRLMAGDGILPLPTDVSPQTRRAVIQSMRLRKDERPQSIKEFLEILDSPSEDTETFIAGPVKAEAHSRKKTKKVATVAVVVAIVCVVAILVGIVVSRHRKPTYEEEGESMDSVLVETSKAETQKVVETNISPSHREQEVATSPSSSTGEAETPSTESSEIAELRNKAVRGDANSQYILGMHYDEGNGVAKDPVEAMRWYWKAAAQGHGEAQCNLGACYEYGEGTTQNFAEAAKWYRKAAEQGVGMAQYNLGLCYYNGKGISQNYVEAANWFRLSAEQDNADAQYNLGMCYYHGQGVNQDYGEAVKWWRKAGGQGCVYAQYNLGICYYYGQGVKQDYGEATMWYRKAAEQGHKLAIYDLGCCYKEGTGVAQSSEEAVKCWTKAALLGNAEAQYNLGLSYGYGDGVERSYEKSIKWLRKAAQQGHAGAKQTLEKLGEK